MRINVHAGHNPDGRIACGAIGIIKESTAARAIKDEVIALLQQAGHEVYDCTVSNGTGSTDVLHKIVEKCNAHEVDLDISIHLNSGRKDLVGDGSIGGCECLIFRSASKSLPYAAAIADNLSTIGYKKRTDQTSPCAGVKVRSGLYVLRNTNAPAILIECCFVDDWDDVEMYDAGLIARAIAEGIHGSAIPITDVSAIEDEDEQVEQLYRVQVGAYRNRANATAMQANLMGLGIVSYIVNG